MKITLLCVGKTDEAYLSTGIEKYVKRLKHYINFHFAIIPDVKNTKGLTKDQQKLKEAKMIVKHIQPTDTLILLDEQGKSFRSTEFAQFLDKKMINSTQNLVFVIGGPYGFDTLLNQYTTQKLSLSKMTFSHQMVRLFFIEQLYRALSILKGEPYHHE
ncbi:23S rRNA (pseudouridine(1915)-N(3))-methyltransferase RlmH [Olivibacter sp. SDN3]|uniref:23S rRNA (pseudouridine(1915)-N(3))-methyltransferase RlmH n=1 Tax=Olivibacter sp. SDN3 TaxID=2764720 RepID=UPI0016515D20|nr:23S rRNA (pseudouridine(1915)-N(3))-methyltransferase RlmH [Olivibacter sp. SDN3]QNL50379.1 23S rRNA (pseudouridine(1915)-N(3))-methyltransferase RlmH [Olivibacter sp. SDN3]